MKAYCTMNHMVRFEMKIIATAMNFGINILVLFVLSTSLTAQNFEGLNHLDGFHIKTYFSDGTAEQAKVMAGRCDNVLAFYNNNIAFEPDVSLLILSSVDWSKHTNFPVYGMPHYNNGKLIVASENNDFWNSFIPPVGQLPNELAGQIIKTYTDDDGELTMKAFFDLLSIHELGHAYHFQGRITMQRKWLSELFVNLMLHTYIAENEPQLLDALTVFPQMVLATVDKTKQKFTSLAEFENHYDEIGQNYPLNYGWYQSKLHSVAGKIYDEGGQAVIEKLWHTLKNQDQILDDHALGILLAEQVHQSLANVLLRWDE